MMLQKTRIMILLVVLSLIAAYVQAATNETVTIAQNGTAEAVIVIAADAAEPERHAATELAGFLRQITGATFEIQVPPAAGQSRLLVGPGAAKSAVADFSTEGLGSDGIIIRTFLEEHIGCRWWSSKASTIPIKPTVEVGSLNVRYVPPLEYRETFWFDSFNGDWAVRNKSNGNSERLVANINTRDSYTHSSR